MFESFEEKFPDNPSQIVVKGTPGFDVLATTLPNAVLSGGAGADTYVFDRDKEVFVTIDDSSLLYPDPGVAVGGAVGGAGGGHDSLMLLEIGREDLVYQREGLDLVLGHRDDVESGQMKYGVRIHQFYDTHPLNPEAPGAMGGETPYPNESMNKIESLYLMGDGVQVVDLGRFDDLGML